MARLDSPSIHLAAYGGVVFPIALLIEGPIIMLLAASTALCRDWDSYAMLRRFMVIAASILTVIHLIVAATPLYGWFVDGLLGVPVEIQAPARIGLLILTPWTAAIAYRRFQQGVLIRFGRSQSVGIGTAVRLLTNATVLAAGYIYGKVPGIVVGPSAVAAGVIVEAVVVGFLVRPVIRGELRSAPPARNPLTSRRLLSFYLPLAVTPLILLIGQPVASAALSRMELPLQSLAVWPVLLGLVFTLRCLGFSFNEVVVVQMEQPGARRVLRRFALILALATTTVLGLVAATPIGRFWFETVSALDPELAGLATAGVWLALILPAQSVFYSYYQGQLVHAHRTRAVTESVILYLTVLSTLLLVAVHFGRGPGLYLVQVAILVAGILQLVWLRRCCNALESPAENREEEYGATGSLGQFESEEP